MNSILVIIIWISAKSIFDKWFVLVIEFIWSDNDGMHSIILLVNCGTDLIRICDSGTKRILEFIAVPFLNKKNNINLRSNALNRNRTFLSLTWWSFASKLYGQSHRYFNKCSRLFYKCHRFYNKNCFRAFVTVFVGRHSYGCFGTNILSRTDGLWISERTNLVRDDYHDSIPLLTIQCPAQFIGEAIHGQILKAKEELSITVQCIKSSCITCTWSSRWSNFDFVMTKTTANITIGTLILMKFLCRLPTKMAGNRTFKPNYKIPKTWFVLHFLSIDDFFKEKKSKSRWSLAG